MKKTLAALLASLMLVVPMAACSDGGDDTPAGGDTSAAETTTGETTPAETGRADVKDNIPDDFNLNGKTLGIYMRAGSIRKYDFDGGGEESGDVIFDAVYQRTRTVEDRLKFKFELTEVSGKWQDFGTGMEQNIMAGDDVWQIVFTTGNAAIQSSRDHLFQDVSQNKYIDFDQPWWWTNAMKELSLDGKKIRYMVGDIHLQNYLTAGSMFFNADKLTDGGYKAEDLYQMVIDRKWTYDKLREMSAAMYKDLNGDGQVNDGDMYGLLVINKELIRHLEFTGNVRRYSRDNNGYPYLDYDQERSVKMIDTLNKLLYETKGNEYRAVAIDYKPFATGNAAFFAGRLSYATTTAFREMEDNYGIIPNPMLDEAQGEYTNIIHNSSDYVTIPVTCKNADEAGAVIEAMCAESYRSVIEIFYESALKMKYSRDSYSGQCIDIIRDTSVKNFIYEYTGVVKGGVMIGEEVANNRNNFASAYAAQKEATDKNIQNLIDKYIKAEAGLNG
ncbi:MAG: hypothetical protein E7662_09380 [Ruminococcaceae bacterium]|nr:hypothetical protein [Oscillospiraceae bacterium]